mgnify:CR=1 FL=1
MIRITVLYSLAVLLFLLVDGHVAEAERHYAGAVIFQLVSEDAVCTPAEDLKLELVAGLAFAQAGYSELASSDGWTFIRGNRRELEEMGERELLDCESCRYMCNAGATQYCACASGCRRRLLRHSDADEVQDDEQRRRLILESVPAAEQAGQAFLNSININCVETNSIQVRVEEI